MKEMERSPQLAFPAQAWLTGALRQASGKAGRPDFVAMWAGQAAPLSRALPAAKLIAALEAEMLAAVQATAGLLKS
jgi:nitronate monooxygenase